jgi:2-keto-4-pentenoate hydratase/2-oxohepta-3-ene-1,7-dioic acid hydratase in catechol pathway
MRLVSFIDDTGVEIGALAEGDSVLVRLQAAQQLRNGKNHPHLASMLAFLDGAGAAREAASRALDFALSERPDNCLRDPGRVALLSPVPRPESIREFMNFEQHVINATRKYGMSSWRARLDRWVERRFGRDASQAKKQNRTWYERPVYYKGNRFSVVGHGADVVVPGYTRVFDYELEFGIYLCEGGRDIPAAQARQHIGGYTVFNDFSARDIQGKEMGGRLGPAKGKDFDTGNSIGPVLVTPDEIPDPYGLCMTARINGEEVSRGSSRDMYFSFEEVIEYVSRSETLYPGEFFGSGTCSGPQGMGCGLEHGRFLKAGDVIELEVERIGVLRNRIVAAQ